MKPILQHNITQYCTWCTILYIFVNITEYCSSMLDLVHDISMAWFADAWLPGPLSNSVSRLHAVTTAMESQAEALAVAYRSLRQPQSLRRPPPSPSCSGNIEEYWWILEMACNIDEYWLIELEKQFWGLGILSKTE